jgi:uncharacterized membrane protein
MSNRWIKIALAVSLTLNLLVIGVIIGRISAEAASQRPFPPQMGWLIRHADPELRQSITPRLRQFHKESKALRRQVQQAQKQVQTAILSDSFDADALQDDFTELRRLSGESQAMMHAAMIDILGEMDANQRKIILENLNRNWRREMRDHDKRPGMGPGKRPGMGPGNSLGMTPGMAADKPSGPPPPTN